MTAFAEAFSIARLFRVYHLHSFGYLRQSLPQYNHIACNWRLVLPPKTYIIPLISRI